MSQTMDIPKEQISYKKVIGKIKSAPVLELMTKGGLFLIVTTKNGNFDVAGVGPHRAVARYIAKKKEPDIEITELSKSEDLQLSDFEFLLSKYETLTEQFRK